MTPFEKAEREKDLINSECFFGNQTFLWVDNANQSYPCRATATDLELDLGVGGFNAIGAVKLTVRQSVFNGGPMPQSQNSITFHGSNYIIATARTDDTGILLILNCVSPRGI